MNKRPKVSLFTSTRDPLKAIALGIDIWHAKDIPARSATAGWTLEELEEKFRWLLKQPHQTPFEYVNLVWVIKNTSRAFQQQLTRHRVGFSYSIQSLRVVNVETFATDRAYHIPSSVIDKESFHSRMLDIQSSYQTMIAKGEKVEDARGILPLNIFSPITMACSYRAVIGLLRQRLCVAAQEEWKEVAEQMRRELTCVHPILAEPLDCMCKRFAKGRGMCKTLHTPVTADLK